MCIRDSLGEHGETRTPDVAVESPPRTRDEDREGSGVRQSVDAFGRPDPGAPDSAEPPDSEHIPALVGATGPPEAILPLPATEFVEHVDAESERRRSGQTLLGGVEMLEPIKCVDAQTESARPPRGDRHEIERPVAVGRRRRILRLSLIHI